MDIKESTTTSIFKRDVAFFNKIKKKKGYASNKITISKAIEILKEHKMEEEI